jgi:hypothetical protein
MGDGSYSLDFDISVCERGDLRGDRFCEQKGALHVVVCYVVHMLSGEGKGFGYKWGVRDSDPREDASMDWH